MNSTKTQKMHGSCKNPFSSNLNFTQIHSLSLEKWLQCLIEIKKYSDWNFLLKIMTGSNPCWKNSITISKWWATCSNRKEITLKFLQAKEVYLRCLSKLKINYLKMQSLAWIGSLSKLSDSLIQSHNKIIS